MKLRSTTVIVIALAVVTFAFPRAADASPPAGVWAGTYVIGEHSTFIRIDFAASVEGKHETVSGVARERRADLVDVAVEAAHIQFGLPNELGILEFDGVWDGNVIAGAVMQLEEHGSFHLQQEIHMDQSAFASFMGSYQLGPDRTLLLVNVKTDQPQYGYFEDDRLIRIYPISDTSFISELGEVIQIDLTSADESVRLYGTSGELYVGRHNEPYREEKVSFNNGSVKLAGSLLLPPGTGTFPVVVFIHGSQGDDREPYRYYADHFARNGIAALIYDKRGTGSSTGNWRRAGFEDLTKDVLAAVNFLKDHPQIDPSGIGIWGISQGGWIVSLAAQRDPEIAFVIGISAPGMTPGKQEAYRVRNVLVDAGSRGIGLGLAMLGNRILYPLGHLATKPYIPLPKSVKDMVGGLAVSPFFNPLPIWRKVRQPVLLVYGEADWLVDPNESARLISDALDRGGNSKYTIVTYETADHSIRLTETGRPSEVLREIRFAPGYFQAKSDWVWSQVGAPHDACGVMTLCEQ